MKEEPVSKKAAKSDEDSDEESDEESEEGSDDESDGDFELNKTKTFSNAFDGCMYYYRRMKNGKRKLYSMVGNCPFQGIFNPLTKKIEK